MDVPVREASETDVAAIQHVARTTWHAAYDEVLGPSAVDRQVAEWYRDDVVANAIDSDDVVYLVADGEDVVGYASAGPSEEDGDGDDSAKLYTLYVDPDHWNDGIGTRLLDDVVERLRGREFETLRVTALEANDVGRSFYESYGLSPVERNTTTVAGTEVSEVVYAGTI